MNRLAFRVSTSTLIFLIASVAWAQDEDGFWPHQAKDHLWEYAMVCGVIVGARRESLAAPSESLTVTADSTILYFNKLPPNHEFVAIIRDHREFPGKPESFVGQKACVYGKIARYKSKQAIMLFISEQFSAESLIGKDDL